MQEVFKQFDADGTGQLTRDELTQVLCGDDHCEVGTQHFEIRPLQRMVF